MVRPQPTHDDAVPNANGVFAEALVRLAQGFSPRPPLEIWGASLDPHWMQWGVAAFGAFWPLVIQVVYGVRSIDPTVHDTALTGGDGPRLWPMVAPGWMSMPVAL